jgi:nitroreductase
MEQEEGALDVFEAMGTARAMRWLKPDPVPWPLLERVLWAATRASSPNNVQPWDFVVVQDSAVLGRIGEMFASLVPQGRSGPPADVDPTTRRTVEGAVHLMANFGHVPAAVFVCGANVYPAGEPEVSNMYSAVFAAAQNLIVAARAVGLGAAFTTLHSYFDAPLRELLGIPGDRQLAATIPLGWPARSFGPVTRKPLEDVIHRDHW